MIAVNLQQHLKEKRQNIAIMKRILAGLHDVSGAVAGQEELLELR